MTHCTNNWNQSQIIYMKSWNPDQSSFGCQVPSCKLETHSRNFIVFSFFHEIISASSKNNCFLRRLGNPSQDYPEGFSCYIHWVHRFKICLFSCTKLLLQNDIYNSCNFGDSCRKPHNSEPCESIVCIVQSCEKRHPRCCKYFATFNICKFGAECASSDTV